MKAGVKGEVRAADKVGYSLFYVLEYSASFKHFYKKHLYPFFDLIYGLGLPPPLYGNVRKMYFFTPFFLINMWAFGDITSV